MAARVSLSLPLSWPGQAVKFSCPQLVLSTPRVAGRLHLLYTKTTPQDGTGTFMCRFLVLVSMVLGGEFLLWARASAHWQKPFVRLGACCGGCLSFVSGAFLVYSCPQYFFLFSRPGRASVLLVSWVCGCVFGDTFWDFFGDLFGVLSLQGGEGVVAVGPPGMNARRSATLVR